MKKAETGIETLIIFLAMIIAAAITVGVLIQIATSMQNKTLLSNKNSEPEELPYITVCKDYCKTSTLYYGVDCMDYCTGDSTTTHHWDGKPIFHKNYIYSDLIIEDEYYSMLIKNETNGYYFNIHEDKVSTQYQDTKFGFSIILEANLDRNTTSMWTHNINDNFTEKYVCTGMKQVR